jgi:hypothetical protein
MKLSNKIASQVKGLYALGVREQQGEDKKEHYRGPETLAVFGAGWGVGGLVCLESICGWKSTPGRGDRPGK